MPSNTASFREPDDPAADPPAISAFGQFRPIRKLQGGHRNIVWLVEGSNGVFVAKSTRRTEAQLRWLSEPQAAARRAGFIVPPLIQAGNGRLAPQGWTLEPYLAGGGATAADMAGLLPALHAFHEAVKTLPQRPGFAALADLLIERHSGDIDLETLPPDLTMQLRRAWADVATEPQTVIHGDIGPQNSLITASGPALIDWDEARRDHAFLDQTALAELTRAQARAHQALEIASCWHLEPDHARALLARFSPFG